MRKSDIIKVFVAVLVLLLPMEWWSGRLTAQTPKQIGDAFANTVNRFSLAETDSLSEWLQKKYRKDALVLTELGRAYFQNRETRAAYRMLDKAIEVNPNAIEPYVQYGDIYKYYWGGTNALDSARLYYAKAMKIKPENPLPYKKMVDLLMFKYHQSGTKQTHQDSVMMRAQADSAVAVLAELKKHNAEYPAELLMGDIYDRMGRFQQSCEAYSKVKELLDDNQYTKYAVGYYFQQQYDKGLAVAFEGQQKFPDYPQLNRPILYCHAELGHNEEALEAYNALRSKSDSIVSLDYWYAGNVYLRKNDYIEAVRAFDFIYDTNDDFRIGYLNKVPLLFKKIADGMSADGNYTEAAETFAIYVDNKRKKSGYDYYVLADIWKSMATDQTLTKEQQLFGIQKADSVYALCQQEFPDYESLIILYHRGNVLWQIDIDEKMENGRALPYFSRLIEEIEKNGEQIETSRKNSLLTQAYSYMTKYYVRHEKLRIALDYANKYKKLNPSDTSFDILINSLTKKSHRK